jgi:hypothetical protein
MSSLPKFDVVLGTRMELRRSKRYGLSAPVVFWWTDSNGILQERTGTTRDICSTGSFVVSDTVPPPGAQVEIDVYLKASAKVVQLRGEGRVVRIEGQQQAASGFAAELAFETEHSNESEAKGSGQPL